ncbi:MAG: Gfo/Idh/MocA family oxidoreductase [Microgenomates group bacterium]
MPNFQNIAVIGFGKMGRLYDQFLTATYIIDVLPVQNRVYFSQLDEFLHYGQPVDLAIVTNPTPLHDETVNKLLSYGINVLCEKPLCFSSDTCVRLERLAKKKGLMLYQSTLERYNPAIQYIKEHIKMSDVDHIESFRFGTRPEWNYTSDPKYDLGIHDVDLWVYLTRRLIPWTMHCGYGTPKRELLLYLKTGDTILLDLQKKLVRRSDTVLDFSTTSGSNPIVEMVTALVKNGKRMNESWGQEIAIIEHMSSGKDSYSVLLTEDYREK